MNKRFILFMPFLCFVILVAFFAVPLVQQKDPHLIASPLLNKPVPAFTFPRALKTIPSFTAQDLQQQVSIVNFFASWCLACQTEQALFKKIAKAENIAVYGVDYKDTPEKLSLWLQKHGNPFTAIGADAAGRSAIDWGVYGVPETFIIDRHGIILYKHVGAVTEDVYQTIFKPILEQAQSHD
jgi:cytochrome c biogenesis protein CcmG/thiol:disulfide interchange protein DsbE